MAFIMSALGDETARKIVRDVVVGSKSKNRMGNVYRLGKPEGYSSTSLFLLATVVVYNTVIRDDDYSYCGIRQSSPSVIMSGNAKSNGQYWPMLNAH
ncbi:unnamed protein product [Litomosoides sigmodontis]|uniref:Uncharacterized protein n=1 Tax=Litomosoides sigmodontis TaxID=42156 RepID=A0A3P6SJS5_LITSI|nr:unnamed protein product [Litomosoides sigmodontis]